MNVRSYNLGDIIQLLALSGCKINIADFRFAMVNNFFRYFSYDEKRASHQFAVAFEKEDESHVIRIVVVWLSESGDLEADFQVTPILDNINFERVGRYFEKDLI